MWIQTGVTVRKRLSWVVTSATLTFDLWPWPFAWTSLLSLVITPENFMMIRWWEHSQKGVTDRQTDRQTDGRTDGRTDWTIHRAAWSQLKRLSMLCLLFSLQLQYVSLNFDTSVNFYAALKTLWPYWHHMATDIWVNFGSGNGLLPDSTEPLPEPMLTDHHWSPLTFILAPFQDMTGITAAAIFSSIQVYVIISNQFF